MNKIDNKTKADACIVAALVMTYLIKMDIPKCPATALGLQLLARMSDKSGWSVAELETELDFLITEMERQS